MDDETQAKQERSKVFNNENIKNRIVMHKEANNTNENVSVIL